MNQSAGHRCCLRAAAAHRAAGWDGDGWICSQSAPRGQGNQGNGGMLSIFLNGCQVTSRVQVMKSAVSIFFWFCIQLEWW